MELKRIKTILGTTLLSMVAMSATAQDLIARQAPVDRRMKDVNNVTINNTLSSSNANLSNPAANIYANWDNSGVWNVKGYAAANTRIDLRGFAMPTTNRKINSPFGRRWGRNHEGLDVKVYIGDTIYAAFDGKVRVATDMGYRRGYGKYIVIRHPNGLETLYGHLSKHLVKADEIVKAGQPIGLGGNTGRSTGSHLHFETRVAGVAIDPAKMFDFVNQDVTSDFFTTRTAYGQRSAVASTTRLMQETEEAALAQAEGETATTTEETASAAAEPAPVKKAPAQNKRNNKATQRTYTVRDGDNLYNIAKRNGTTVDKICRSNGISSKSTLRPGQKLKI